MNKQKVDNIQESSGRYVLSPSDLSLENVEIDDASQGFSVWVRALLQNWRQGTVAVKGRSDVSFSNKKPWKQKGTGRARAGSARSPLWRGGGVTFGPQERSKTLKISKKLKKNVLTALLMDRVNAGAVSYLDWELRHDAPKTSLAYHALKKAGLVNQPITIFLSVNDMLAYSSFINIPHVRILFFDQANAFDLAHNTQWVILKKDIDQFKKMVAQWI